MIIPRRKPIKVLSDDIKVDRKKEAEEFLRALGDSTPQYSDPEPDADAHQALHRFLCGCIMWATIIGTLALTTGGVYYLTVPSPSVYVTTQNGNLHLLRPTSVQR